MLDRSIAPAAYPVEKVLFPTPSQFTLSNGIEVWVVSAGEQEVFKFELSTKAGAIHSPLAGIAGMTASLMKRGTSEHSAQEIHQNFKEVIISSAILREAVAAGEGALQTFTMRSLF